DDEYQQRGGRDRAAAVHPDEEGTGARRHDGSLLPNGSAKLSSPKDSDGTVPEEIDEGRKTPLCMEKHLTPLCPVGDGRSGRRRPRPDAVHQLRERFRERVDAVPL